MDRRTFDAFFLYNEREKVVDEIHEALEKRGLQLFFWRKDIPIGETWDEVESQALTNSHVVCVFLGAEEVGSTHLPLTKKAKEMEASIANLSR